MSHAQSFGPQVYAAQLLVKHKPAKLLRPTRHRVPRRSSRPERLSLPPAPASCHRGGGSTGCSGALSLAQGKTATINIPRRGSLPVRSKDTDYIHLQAPSPTVSSWAVENTMGIHSLHSIGKVRATDQMCSRERCGGDELCAYTGGSGAKRRAVQSERQDRKGGDAASVGDSDRRARTNDDETTLQSKPTGAASIWDAEMPKLHQIPL
ncbi:hypothetical protein C8F04DRAFT_1189296 [Mycena alexandri]|uniref:Uncharacterized protein n=1 Tax=Mycena alexandri TaxID=1745969 RepID=A0AAD6SIP4_9AGAR|nr:hypothetical protein C8F04DRAFT_1189296 [Mycena alexandri]